jgi:hypothetical protein
LGDGCLHEAASDTPPSDFGATIFKHDRLVASLKGQKPGRQRGRRRARLGRGAGGGN